MNFSTILSTLLALFGLGVLVFIHELGHYFVAKRVGMRVEAFSIGFGKPILSWKKDGVDWQVGWLPFGGFVRIGGMEKEGSLEPHQIPDGFFGKKPAERIKVALAGPIVNIFFALFIFAVIWGLGGRDKSFAEFTKIIGSVKGQSALAEEGVSAGDEILYYGDRPFEGFSQLQIAAIFQDRNGTLKGDKINYLKQERTPFEAKYQLGDITSPARYLFYGGESENPTVEASGMKKGDRIIWADGEVLFSNAQLSSILSENRAFITLERGNEKFSVRVPKIDLKLLRLTERERDHLGANTAVSVPFHVTNELEVSRILSFYDENYEESVFHSNHKVEKGDRIISVDGTLVNNQEEFLNALQHKNVTLIVQREAEMKPISWKEADKQFIDSLQLEEINQLVSGEKTHVGSHYRLSPIAAKPMREWYQTPKKKAEFDEIFGKYKTQIERTIKDHDGRELALRQLKEETAQLKLGISLLDMPVKFNPGPFKQFISVFDEIKRTLVALVRGVVSPKGLAGPVGIVQVMQRGWQHGVTEALYWLGMISLNLGILNLMPVPVLDGGHICFSIYEAVTKKPIKAKTMQRLVLPFVVLLICFFVFVTFHDLVRILHALF